MDCKKTLTEDYYPDWLYRDLVEDLLPWQQGKEMTFKEFDRKYTLHDSHWVGIFYDVAYTQNVTLSIQWDYVWLPKEIKKNQSRLDGWPYLFIRLLDVEQIHTANYKEIFKSKICRTISGCEYEEIEEKKFLAIDDVYGGQINIVYTGKEIFLALEENKNVLKF